MKTFFAILFTAAIFLGAGCSEPTAPSQADATLKTETPAPLPIVETEVQTQPEAVPTEIAPVTEQIETQKIIEDVDVIAPAKTPEASKAPPVAPSAPIVVPEVIPVEEPETIPVKTCCKTCSKGKACGNSCISREDTCHKAPGCACDG
jgi:hypothetical protein